MTILAQDALIDFDYRIIFDASSNGMAFTSASSGQIVNVNAAWTRATGIAVQAAIGKTALELGIWKNPEEREVCLATLERNGCLEEQEVQLFTKVGVAPHLVSAHYLQSAGERYVLWEFRDISVQKQVSNALQAASDWHRSLLQHTVDGICIFDENKSVIETNDRFAAMLGYSTQEMPGKHPWDWDVNVSETELEDRFPPVNEANYTIETSHRRKDGSTYEAEVTIRHAQIDNKNIVVTVVRDISERKKLEVQLREAKELLEIERSLLKTLVRTIPNLVWLKDTEGKYLACNAEFESFFGHPETEIVGKTDFDFVPTELANFFRENDRQAMVAGKPTLNEEWITYASTGRRAFLITTKTPMYRTDGSIVGVLGVSQDITNLRRQTEELQSSREALNRAQEVAHVGSWVLDIGSSLLEWSDEAYRIFGVPVGTPMTLVSFLGCIHPEDLVKVGNAWNAAIAGSDYDIEHRVLVDNQTRWVRERALIERDGNGIAIRGLGTVQDITEQKHAAYELAQSQALLRSVLDAVPVRIFWKDRDSRYLGCNPLFAQDAGKASPDELIGKLDSDMGWADQADLYRADDCRVMESGEKKLNFEEPQTTPDGNTIYLSTSKVPLRDQQGAVFGILGIYDDVTARRQTENQLKESEEQHRALFNTSRDAIFLHDGPVFVDCNPAALELLGATDRTQIIGKSPLDFSLDDPAKHQQALKKIQEAMGGTPQFFEWTSRRLDGRLIQVDMQLVKVSIGKKDLLQGIARDITERKKTELALQEERRVRDTILESIPGVFYAMDSKGDLIFWNHNFELATGRLPSELLKLNTLSLFEGEDRIHISQRINEVFQSGKSDAEADLVAKDGSRTRFYFTGSRIELEGEPILVGSGIDIGPLKSAERELRLLNEQLEERVRRNTKALQISYAKLSDTEFAMDTVGIGIHWVDYFTGRFIHANRFAAALLGYSQEELLQRTVSDIDPNFPEDAFREVTERIRNQGFLKFETEQLCRDGTLVPVEMTVYYHPQTEETPPRMISFMVDISQRKQAEKDLIEAKALAESASQAKSAFLANMSHEIRTPLNAILGLNYLLRQEALTPAQMNKLEKVEISGRHLLSLINDILDLSKVEAGKLVLEHGNFHLSAVLDSVGSIVRDSANTKGLRLTIDSDHVPKWLWGDSTRLRQSLLNFAGNAVKFTERGEVRIQGILLDEIGEQLRVRFQVSDTGIGLTEEQKAQLFQDFQQADGSISRKYGGTGLGLSLTQKLIDLMGGVVGVESVVGQGSTFWFEVPLEKGHGPISLPQTPPSFTASALEVSLHGGQRVLLAEDNPINVEVVCELLHGIKLDVDVARNGKEALEMASKGHYSLVLMDMQMPELNGVEATKAIRQLPEWSSVPIIALTANAFLEDRQACLDAGMNAVLTKPVEPSSLYQMLHEWLDKTSVADVEVKTNEALPSQPSSSTAITHLRQLPGVDIEAALKRLNNNEDRYLRLLNVFLQTSPDQLARGVIHLKNQQPEELRNVIHTLKGASGTLGLNAIADLAAELDSALRTPVWLNHHSEETEALLAEISTQLLTLSAVVSRYQS